MNAEKRITRRPVEALVLLLCFPLVLVGWVYGRTVFRAYWRRQPDSYERRRRLRRIAEYTFRKTLKHWWSEVMQNAGGEH